MAGTLIDVKGSTDQNVKHKPGISPRSRNKSVSELPNHSDSGFTQLFFFWTSLENCITVPLVENKAMIQVFLARKALQAAQSIRLH